MPISFPECDTRVINLKSKTLTIFSIEKFVMSYGLDNPVDCSNVAIALLRI